MNTARCLYQVNVRGGLDGGGLLRIVEEEAGLGGGVLSLQVNSLGLASSDGGLVGLVGHLAGDDLSLASGGLDVGNGNVDLLLHNSGVHHLIHGDANGSLGDVEHNTSTALVELVGHTLVDGRVNSDINIVTALQKTNEHNDRDQTMINKPKWQNDVHKP
jgi:hypothetical protein